MSDSAAVAVDCDSALRSAIQLAMAKSPRCDAASLAALRAYPLLTIVKGMQPELTSKESRTIPLAMQVLGFAAIERESADLLPTTQDLEVVFAFLVAKINHFTTMDSAVDATSRIFVWYAANHPKLLTAPFSKAQGNTPILKSVINNMLCKISVPSMFGNSKTSAFALLKALLSPSIVEYFSKDETQSFLEAFLVSVDGERDPQFVLDVFTMAYSILTSFSAATLSNFTEEYFMTLSNYFPVLFNPPPRCTVTKEELKTALTAVLVLPVFSEVCIPFVLSKLSSPAEVAKVDSLGLLHDIFSRVASSSSSSSSAADASPAYSVSLLESHIADVLGSLRGEALKLAASVAFNPSAKDLLRLVMSVAEDVGKVLDVMGGGGNSNANSDAAADNNGAVVVAGPSPSTDDDANNATTNASAATSNKKRARPLEISKAARDTVLSHCDRTLTACLGTIDAGSDARAYAMLLNALCKGGDVVCSVLCSYLFPMIGIKLLGLEVCSGGGGASSSSSSSSAMSMTPSATAKAEQEERIYMSCIAVIGGLFSAVELRKNGNTNTNTSNAAAGSSIAIAVKPQTTVCIVNALVGCVEATAARHQYLEDALPLIVEVISTFIAIRDVLPGGEEESDADETDNASPPSAFVCPSSVAILQQLLRRACATHTEQDASTIAMKAIGNVGRVATSTVLKATVLPIASASASLAYELAASPRLPSFFVQLHNAVGSRQEVRTAALNALLLGDGSSSNSNTIISAAVNVFGYVSPTIDGYLHALALFAATEAQQQSSSGTNSNETIKRVIDTLLALALPERCGAGADLLCELLARCPDAQGSLLATADPIAANVMVSWLCAVTSASKEAVAQYYNPQTWIGLCLGQLSALPTTTCPADQQQQQQQQSSALALRAIASIANKGAEDVISAAVFEAAMDGMSSASASLSDGARAAVRAAVCKGLLARGANAADTLAPLLKAVEAMGAQPVPIGISTAAATTNNNNSSSAELLVTAFGQLVSPPFPSSSSSSSSSSSPMWIQRTYLALIESLTALGTPVALACVGELVRKAPPRVVAATSTELVQKLTAILEAGNTINTNTSAKSGVAAANTSAVGSTPSLATPSLAAMLCIARLLDRADGMPLDAMRCAVVALLTYSSVSKGLYNLVYAANANVVNAMNRSAPTVVPAVPMALRDVLVSALLAAQAVVTADLEAGAASNSSNKGTGKVSGGSSSSASPNAMAAEALKALARDAKAKWIVAWLRTALDDPKRPIRTLASKASHEWHKVK